MPFAKNQRVRCIDSKAPIFHRRVGHIFRVNEPGKYSQRPTLYQVCFLGSERVYGDFAESDLEAVPDPVYNPADPRSQLEQMEEHLADDMACWVEESLVAFQVALAEKFGKYREVKR